MRKHLWIPAVFSALMAMSTTASAAERPFECTVEHWALDNATDTPTFKQTFVATYDTQLEYSYVSEDFKIGQEPWSLWAYADEKGRTIQYVGPKNASGYMQNYEVGIDGDVTGPYYLYVGPQGAGIFTMAIVSCGPVGTTQRAAAVKATVVRAPRKQ